MSSEASLSSPLLYEEERRLSKRAVVGTVIGNWLEFFDFTIYAVFALTIGRQFFPVASETGQLLLSLATFGVGFFTRPLGGIVIGAYADRVGRKPALTLTIMMMALGTAIIGLTPPYSSIGIAAPILIVIARLLQGFSAGGELGTSVTYLVEAAPKGKRGLYGAWQGVSQGLASVVGALMGYGLNLAFSAEAMESWGWRLPFFFGLLIAPVGLYIRRHMLETKEQRKEARRVVLRELLSNHYGVVVAGMFTVLGTTVSVYVIGSYIIVYANRTLGMDINAGLLGAVVSGVGVVLGSFFGGWLSDYFGRRLLMIAPRVLLALAIYPAFWFITEFRNEAVLLWMVGLLSFLLGITSAVVIIALPECFPRSVRAAGVSTSYGLGVTIFGSTAQIIAAWLVDTTGNPMSVSWYLITANVVSILALLYLKPPTPNDELR